MANTQIPAKGLSQPNFYRNLVINGDFTICQRNTSATSVGSASGTYEVHDRFELLNNSMGAFTVAQGGDVPTGEGFAKHMQWDCTTADASPASGDYLMMRQKFEGQNLQHLKKGTSNAEKLTASFWVKSNKTGTYICELFDVDNSRCISRSYTINTANTWEKKILTFDGDTSGSLDNDFNNSLNIQFWLGAGSDYTSGTLQTSWDTSGGNASNRVVGQVNLADSTDNEWFIVGLQLEIGEVASNFENIPHEINLQRCMRYYEKSFNPEEIPGTVANADGYYVSQFTTSSSNQNYYPVRYSVIKRDEPTVTVYSTTTGTSAKYRNITDNADRDANVQRSGHTGWLFRPTSSTGIAEGDVFAFHWQADCEL